jgi:hypothetical protein
VEQLCCMQLYAANNGLQILLVKSKKPPYWEKHEILHSNAAPISQFLEGLMEPVDDDMDV